MLYLIRFIYLTNEFLCDYLTPLSFSLQLLERKLEQDVLDHLVFAISNVLQCLIVENAYRDGARIFNFNALYPLIKQGILRERFHFEVK